MSFMSNSSGLLFRIIDEPCRQVLKHRWRALPRVVFASELVSHIEGFLHLVRIEGKEVLTDLGVVGDGDQSESVTPDHCGRVSAQQHSIRGVTHHCTEYRTGKVQSVVANGLRLLGLLSVVNDENGAWAVLRRLWFFAARETDDDKVFANPTVREQEARYLDGRKGNGRSSRGAQHLLIELKRLRRSLLGDHPHVPDPGLTVVEVGRSYPKPAMCVMGGRSTSAVMYLSSNACSGEVSNIAFFQTAGLAVVCCRYRCSRR